MHKVLIFIALLSVCTAACRLEPEPPLPNTWNLIESNPNVLNMQVIEDRLFVQTNTSVYTLTPSGVSTPCLTFEPVSFPIAMSAGIVAVPSTAGHYIDFFPTKDLCGDSAGKRVYLSQIGFPVTDFAPTYFFKSTMAVSDSGQFLVALLNNQEKEDLFLFSVRFKDAGQTDIDTVTVQKISPPGHNTYRGINAFHGKLFAGYYRFDADGNHTIIVQPDGSIQDVLPDIADGIFSVGNTWYASGETAQLFSFGVGGYPNFFKSVDEGITWTQSSWPVPRFPVDLGTVYEKLISLSSQTETLLMVVEETEDPYLGRNWQLDMTGLTYGYSMLHTPIEWQGQVYAWTPYGIFSKPLAEFFTTKGS